MMLQKWFILLPELSFIVFFVTAHLVDCYRQAKTAKTFFTLSKFFLVVCLISTIIFYNKSAYPLWLKNTPYTTLFKVVIYLISLVWFYLSSKWFLNKNRPSYKFYQLAMLALLLLEMLISTQNFLLVIGFIPLLCWVTWKLLRLHWDAEAVNEVARLYAFFSVLFSLLLAAGIGLLYSETHSFNFAEVYQHFNTHDDITWRTYAAIGMIMSSLLYMLALAPFHSWFVGIISVAILPVSGFLTLIPPFAYLACLINAMIAVFWSAADFVKPVLLIFAGLSLFIGALSANSDKNIRQLFAFSSVYHMGFLIFTIISFNDNSILSAFVYIMIYALAMLGVYTVFLGLKSRGNYLTCLADIKGLSTAKPYISASLFIFMFSLIGIPPLLGFLGRLSVINNLVLEERWSSVFILLISMLFMANAYLQVIRTVYFEPLENKFDRTDKAIYICLFINLALVLISTLNPGYLLHDAERILNGIL